MRQLVSLNLAFPILVGIGYFQGIRDGALTFEKLMINERTSSYSDIGLYGHRSPSNENEGRHGGYVQLTLSSR